MLEVVFYSQYFKLGELSLIKLKCFDTQCRYEPLGYLLGGEYFYHAYGPIYALSSEVVAGLAVARNDR